jgi:hypothetical protein
MARCLWLGTVILATFEGEIRRIEFWGQSRETVQETLISKMTRTKWTGSVAYTVECLLFKCKALSSKPSFTKKKKKNTMESGSGMVSHSCNLIYSRSWGRRIKGAVWATQQDPIKTKQRTERYFLRNYSEDDWQTRPQPGNQNYIHSDTVVTECFLDIWGMHFTSVAFP